MGQAEYRPMRIRDLARALKVRQDAYRDFRRACSLGLELLDLKRWSPKGAKNALGSGLVSGKI